MVEFFMAGGWSMWFVLVFGLLTIASAVVFATRADARKIAVVRALTWTSVFAILAGMLVNFMTVMRTVAGSEELRKSPDCAAIVMQGLGETVTTGILGFAMLAISWLIVAVGTRRVQDLGE